MNEFNKVLLRKATISKIIFTITSFVSLILTISLIIINTFFYSFGLMTILLITLLVMLLISLFSFSSFLLFYKKYVYEQFISK